MEGTRKHPFSIPSQASQETFHHPFPPDPAKIPAPRVTTERPPVSSGQRFDAERLPHTRAGTTLWEAVGFSLNSLDRGAQRGGGRGEGVSVEISLDGTSPVSHPKWRGASVPATNTVPRPVSPRSAHRSAAG